MIMRKFFLIAALFAAMTINATDLFVGSQLVEWGDGLKIEASKFADVVAGQKLVFTYEDATDGLEFKVLNEHFDHLAGSRKNVWINGNGSYELYLTPGAVAAVKEHGLQIIGAHFTATKVEVVDGEAREGVITLWKGFYWVDNWGEMLFYPEVCTTVDWSTIDAIRFYSEAGRSDFDVNFKKGWGDGEHIGGISDMSAGDGYVELPLNDARRELLASVDNELIVQCFKGDNKAAFNATDIVLVPKKETPTSISRSSLESKAVKMIENGQVIIIRDGVRYNALGARM